MLLRHLQDVCENLGVLNRYFSCWCHTKSVGSWHGFMFNIFEEKEDVKANVLFSKFSSEMCVK